MKHFLTGLTISLTLCAAAAAQSAGSSVSPRMQEIAQQELEAGLQDYRAGSGCMLVLDASTGDILAQAVSGSTMTANTYFEPGGLFIPVTVAAAMEYTRLTPETLIDINTLVTEEGDTIESLYPHRALPAWCVIAKSLDAAAARIALSVGAGKLNIFLHQVGFNHEGTFSHASAQAGCGRKIRVTPLQIAGFYAALANGGRKVIPDTMPGAVAGERIMAVQHCTDIISAMEAAVTGQRAFNGIYEPGTAGRAAVPGARVACSTGTTPINNTTDGADTARECIASAIGIVPADKPAMAVLVVLENPRPPFITPGGDTVAAPILSKTLQRLLPEIGITPQTDTQSRK